MRPGLPAALDSVLSLVCPLPTSEGPQGQGKRQQWQQQNCQDPRPRVQLSAGQRQKETVRGYAAWRQVQANEEAKAGLGDVQP